MQPDERADWMSAARIAEAHGLTVAEVMALAECMNWPRVSRARETLILMPNAPVRT